MQLEHPDLGLYFSPPIQSLTDGSWVLGFSRRLDSAEGSFAGAVMGRIPLSFFQDLFARLEVGDHATINLLSTDRRLIARSGLAPGDIGRDMSGAAVFQHLAEAPLGRYTAVAGLDGVRRLYTYRRLDHLPFVIVIGIPTSQIFAHWLQRTLIVAGVLLTMVLIAAGSSWALWREFGRRFRAEAAVRHSEERLQQLLDNVVDHAIYSLGPNGEIASWTPGAQNIKGYAAAEILGQHFSRFFTPEDVAADTPGHLLEHARTFGRYDGHGWRVRKDGGRFWARISITAIRDPDGTLLGFAKVAHDLTSQQVEEAQRAIIIEQAPNGMLIVDEHGRITLANAQADKIFGYSAGSLHGQPIEMLVPWTGSGIDPGDGQGLASERQFNGMRRDGSLVAIELMLRPVRSAHGSVVVVSVFDVTERLRLAAERAEAEARERTAAAETNARLESLTRHLAKSRDQGDAGQ